MSDTLTIARDYKSRGWQPIPVPFRAKKPVIDCWPTLRLSVEELAAHFNGKPTNIGVLLGSTSNGLIDVDLDSPEAVALGDWFLQETSAVFGRESKPRSHRLFSSPKLAKPQQFRAPDGTMVVEVRSTGGQTVFPGSVHESGEPIEWFDNGEPTAVSAGELGRSVGRLAAAALLSAHWPAKGSRHDAALALTGGLLRGGFSRAHAEHFIRAVATAAQDDEIEDRVKTVATTEARLELDDGEAWGWPRLAEIISEKVVKRVRDWLGLRAVARSRPSETRADLVCFADVRSEVIRWLWPGRIAIGKVSMIAGDPGLGKSLVTLDMAARVSRGTPWPDRPGEPISVGAVVLLSAEDDAADTIRPRLDASGADVSKIMQLRGVNRTDLESGNVRSCAFCLEHDLEILEAAINVIPDCRLVVVDPISAYLGKTDSHVNAEVRAILAPLGDLASRLGVAIVAVTHLRKGEGPAIYRSIGSLAFAAAARAVWAVTKDSDDPTGARRLFLPVKNNLASEGSGLAYYVRSAQGSTHPTVCWEPEPVAVSADEAMRLPARPRGPAASERDEIVDWLRGALADGPRLAKELYEEGIEANGFAKRTIERARKAIKVVVYRPDNPGPWWWRLPDGSDRQEARGSRSHSKPGGVAVCPETFGKVMAIAAQSSQTAKFSGNGKLPMKTHDDRGFRPPDRDENGETLVARAELWQRELAGRREGEAQ